MTGIARFVIYVQAVIVLSQQIGIQDLYWWLIK